MKRCAACRECLRIWNQCPDRLCTHVHRHALVSAPNDKVKVCTCWTVKIMSHHGLRAAMSAAVRAFQPTNGLQGPAARLQSKDVAQSMRLRCLFRVFFSVAKLVS